MVSVSVIVKIILLELALLLSVPATGMYSFQSLIVKIILLELASSLSATSVAKIQHFVHLNFNLTCS